MTAPREILPGETYLLTRRVTRREFLLRPDKETNGIFEYCLAEAAVRHKIGLVAWLAMSNHYHAVVHDPEGRLPAFLEHFHKMVAKCLNARWGRWENFWSTEETCVTRLVAPADIFDKVVYVLANPVLDDLVDRIDDWPGCSAKKQLGGRATEQRRPSFFFNSEGTMPARVTLRTKLPPCISKRESAAAWVARVRSALAAKEAEARAARLAANRRVVGRKAVRRASPFDAPKTIAPRRKLRPAVACKDAVLRAAALDQLKSFRSRYSVAWHRFATGDRRVEFPAGSYRMRLWKMRCAPFPAHT